MSMEPLSANVVAVVCVLISVGISLSHQHSEGPLPQLDASVGRCDSFCSCSILKELLPPLFTGDVFSGTVSIS